MAKRFTAETGARGGDESGPLVRVQAEGVGEKRDGLRIGPVMDPAFERPDGVERETGPLGELPLAQAYE
jgi:hypothetical protein